MTRPRPAPITDSPLFWLLLFGSVGLVLLTAIEPKFIKRQERIERMHESRQRARPADRGQTRDLTAAPAWQPTGRVSLRPLMLFLAGVLLVTMVVMQFRRQRSIAQFREAEAADNEGKTP